MKDVLMVAHFIGLPREKGNNRFIYLAKLLSESENEVELVTSDFSHSKKQFRSMNAQELSEEPYKITLIHEIGYKKNVCLRRLKSHKVFAKNLDKYLKTRKIPDVVYCSVPSLDAAYVAARYCKINNIKLVVDIQDLWPEAFQMVLNIPLFSNVIFWPMKRKANKIYASADEIIAVSETYARRGMRVNDKCKDAKIVYLGTDRDTFDQYASLPADKLECPEETAKVISNIAVQSKSKLLLAYCGTLGSSYDLEVVFEAMRKLDSSALNCIELVIMGDGPKRLLFEEMAAGLPVVFIGALPYSVMVWLLTRCHIAVCPIVKGAAQSIINKHMDYAMAGLPVVNTQECQEYRTLLNRYACGINCECGNAEDVAKGISALYKDAALRKSMGDGSRAMAVDLFDRKKAYEQIKDLIESI